MSDTDGGNQVASQPTVKSVEEFAGFHNAPLVLAAVGFVVTFIATFLPFVTVSISAFGGNLGAYEGASPSPWFLSLPIAWVALLLGLVVVMCAVALVRTEQSPGTDYAFAFIMTSAGLLLLVIEFFENFWVAHRVEELAGFLSGAIDATVAIGYFAMLLGAAILTAAGVAALLKANTKRGATSAPFESTE